jgi:hypothetical protein
MPPHLSRRSSEEIRLARQRGTRDWKDIEQLRVQGFRSLAAATTGARSTSSLPPWGTGSRPTVKDLGDLAVKRKLELVGKSTAQILLTTEKESEKLRAQTEEECAELWESVMTAGAGRMGVGASAHVVRQWVIACSVANSRFGAWSVAGGAV